MSAWFRVRTTWRVIKAEECSAVSWQNFDLTQSWFYVRKLLINFALSTSHRFIGEDVGRFYGLQTVPLLVTKSVCSGARSSLSCWAVVVDPRGVRQVLGFSVQLVRILLCLES